MILGLLVLLVLVAALFIRRTPAHEASESFRPWQSRASRAERIGGAMGALLSALPLWPLAPWHGAKYFGDSSTHARVAQDIALSGLPHGWIESYVGGFPAGHHYPFVGWALMVLPIRAGIPTAVVSHTLGFLAIAATPWAAYWAARHCGARPLSALAGCLLIAWVSPYNPFVGGFEVYFTFGLLSQVIAVPLCIVTAALAIRGRSMLAATIASMACIAAHPQVTVGAFAVLGLTVLAVARRDVIVRVVRAGAAAGAFGAAIYSQGVATLKIPFGWPNNLNWRRFGFDISRLEWWLVDGELLDNRRALVLTTVCLVALLVCVLRIRHPACRGAFMAFWAAVLLSVAGRPLLQLGPVAEALLYVIQPLRVVAMVPLAAASVLVVALEEGLASLGGAAETRWGVAAAQKLRMALALAVTASFVFVVPERWSMAQEMVSQRPPDQPCGPNTPPGYDRPTLNRLLASLSKGRLWHTTDTTSPIAGCAIVDAWPLQTAVPIGVADAVGAQVGTHWLAYRLLAPERPGGVTRAEALGIRYALTDANQELPGWRMLAEPGGARLFTHDQPTDLVGLGCVREHWSANARELERVVAKSLAEPSRYDALISPTRLVQLTIDSGPLRQQVLEEGDCDATRATVVSEHHPEPGLVQAEIRAERPVVAVIRVTSFPGWKVQLNDQPVRPMMVLPGFLAVPLQPGTHRIVATAGLMPGYLWLIAAGALVALASGTARKKHADQVVATLRRAVATRMNKG